MSILKHYEEKLDILKLSGNFRQFTANQQNDHWITIQNNTMLNLSSNDYLGLASKKHLAEQFLDEKSYYFSSSSSRLLTGNFEEYTLCEKTLSDAFLGRSALLFNSGYHMNIGILPALADNRTLILADKLVHASIIDGIRLSQSKYLRYRHNDLEHLSQLIAKHHDDLEINRIIVVTESIFSMDGDEADLIQLVKLKKQFPKVMLYVDEAHAIGVRGHSGLGCAQQYQVIPEIDFLVGTFGKAVASVGGYLICEPVIRDYLINTMRPLIFSTALPPINIAWTTFMFKQIQTLQKERRTLAELSSYLQSEIIQKGYSSPSTSHLIPIIIGESEAAVTQAKVMQEHGFYIMPVRPPTVPKNSARLRVSLTASIPQFEIERLVDIL
ncbi:8-amino-7-oxononanoate synthase [Acinetobacter pollinis]|uniref:8-amino-7-oxononanoate synthase n=1 Tax=Acinetobacter pollinis TaxID=2605270 RepID=A0ABU6DRQ2_9GAMM|nr:8-amino-7-oxononanoate synthase [Acinetobacter pollinis]MEB5476534.1 8-amino-7-oxononanoate synthase [Acinetobacter pollinis]